MLYVLWRFRGVDPYERLHGGARPPGPFPDRHDALLTAFAVHAALNESAVRDLGEALAGLGV